MVDQLEQFLKDDENAGASTSNQDGSTDLADQDNGQAPAGEHGNEDGVFMAEAA